MEEIAEIIASQWYYLKQIGFGKVGMNNEIGPALFKEHLEDQLMDILADDDSTSIVPILGVNIGHYPTHNGIDTVAFYFFYDFDLLDRELLLREVHASMDGVTIPLTIESNQVKDCWHSKEFYTRLKNLTEALEPGIRENYESRIKAELRSNNALLTDTGYNDNTLCPAGKPEALKRQLEKKTRQAVTKGRLAGKNQYFSVETKPATLPNPSNEQPEQVKFSVHYRFIPQLPQLKPVSVTTWVNEVPTTLRCSAAVPLVSTNEALSVARGDERLKLSLELLARSTTNRYRRRA